MARPMEQAASLGFLYNVVIPASFGYRYLAAIGVSMGIHIRLMTAADVSFGMRLKAANGWNQTEADWHRYLDLQPDGCFVAEIDGNPVGTLTTCIFGTVAWIAMMLVDVSQRRRGIGLALMQHAIDFLTHEGVISIRLDATPLGQRLYE